MFSYDMKKLIIFLQEKQKENAEEQSARKKDSD